MVKIGNILQDQSATNFLIVCIAEFLSINESQRLLQELQRNSVRVSHVVVNQLVQGWVSDAEMPAFDKLLARADPRPDEDELLSKIQASIELTNARGGIQAKYLAEFRAFPEVDGAAIQVIELPLLAGEVTGPEAILSFSQKLVGDGYRGAAAEEGPRALEGWTATKWSVDGASAPLPSEAEGAAAAAGDGQAAALDLHDRVKIDGLANAAQYNGYTGKVVEFNDNGRVGVEIIFKAARKRLSLKPANLTKVSEEEQRGEKRPAPAPAGPAGPMAGMMSTLLEDPDVVEAMKNPKVKAAYDDVVANGMMAGMKYFGDPDCAPIIQKVMGKLGMGGMGGGAPGGLGGGA